MRECYFYVKMNMEITKCIGGQISSWGFARDGVTTVSFHHSVFISMRWKAVISRY